MTAQVPNVLSIAGSDPSGGAGIQADLKTFGALGAYGMAALTALTAQNTLGVQGIHAVPPEFLATQLRSIFDDIEVHSVKVGMVGNAPAIREVARALRQHAPRWVTVDPVMVAKGGQALLEPDSVRALITELLPLAAVLTPNLPEAAVLLGVRSLSRDELGDAASALGRLTGGTIVLKGGHLDDGGPATDMVCHGGSLFALESARVATKNTHGTGCTYSSAIAALLPQSESPEVAIRRAKIYVTDAIVAAHELRVGHGHGPIQHFCARNRDKHA